MRDLIFTIFVCTNPEVRRHTFTFPGGEGGPRERWMRGRGGEIMFAQIQCERLFPQIIPGHTDMS